MYEAQCFYHNRADEGRDIQEITVAYYVKVGRAEIPTAESQRKEIYRLAQKLFTYRK